MTAISNGESGSSVRTKLNASLAVTDKAVVLAAYDNTDHSHTGDTNEFYMTGLLVPTLTTNSILTINAQLEKIGTAATITWRLYYNTTNDLSGSPVKIATGAHTATVLQTWFERSIVNKNSLTLNRIFLGTSGSATDKAINTVASQTINADLSGKYLVFSAQNTNAGDTSILANCQLIHTHP